MAGLVLFYLGSGITVIGPNETGLVLRFGKLLPQTHPPGLLFSFPPPIDEVLKVPLKSVQEVALDAWSSLSENGGLSSLDPATQFYTLTGDANIVRAQFVVRYQISDPIDYALAARDRDAIRDAILYESATRVLSSMNVEDALTAKKNYIGQEAMRLAQEKMNALGLGIQLLAVETREINPPKTVLAAFQAVISAKVQSKTLIEEANTYAASSIPDAQAQAYRIQQVADSYAQQLVAKAQGESISFTALLGEYRANPMLVRARLYGEMVSTVMPQVKVATVVPGGKGSTRIFLDPQKGSALKSTITGNDTQPTP